MPDKIDPDLLVPRKADGSLMQLGCPEWPMPKLRKKYAAVALRLEGKAMADECSSERALWCPKSSKII